MPVLVVDLFEVVDIDHQQGQWMAEAARPFQFQIDLLRHATAVADAGQRIGGGQQCQPAVCVHQLQRALMHMRFQLAPFLVQCQQRLAPTAQCHHQGGNEHAFEHDQRHARDDLHAVLHPRRLRPVQPLYVGGQVLQMQALHGRIVEHIAGHAGDVRSLALQDVADGAADALGADHIAARHARHDQRFQVGEDRHLRHRRQRAHHVLRPRGGAAAVVVGGQQEDGAVRAQCGGLAVQLFESQAVPIVELQLPLVAGCHGTHLGQHALDVRRAVAHHYDAPDLRRHARDDADRLLKIGTDFVADAVVRLPAAPAVVQVDARHALEQLRAFAEEARGQVVFGDDGVEVDLGVLGAQVLLHAVDAFLLPDPYHVEALLENADRASEVFVGQFRIQARMHQRLPGRRRIGAQRIQHQHLALRIRMRRHAAHQQGSEQQQGKLSGQRRHGLGG